MLKDHPPIQTSYEFVSLEDLVPQDHLVRKIDQSVDFSFIHDLVADLYCSN
ncbi:IS5/IS1182 family transposase, partial [Marinicella sp. S6413]|nr:IS5/IS1182 family transposase [Marinicella gelatinilytica]